MASRAIDTVITFRVLKLLTMKWTDHEAFDMGIIDKKGKIKVLKLFPTLIQLIL